MEAETKRVCGFGDKDFSFCAIGVIGGFQLPDSGAMVFILSRQWLRLGVLALKTMAFSPIRGRKAARGTGSDRRA